MTTLDDRPAVKPCGCPEPCDHLPYARLAAANKNLGAVLDAQAEVMRVAIRAAAQEGPAAGMNVIVRYVRSVSELAEGLQFSDDMPGGDR
ncbi:hypothetical protein Sme01_03700 [Sphaerisporangium melleum]|uniref:Uncharacterized protein n=1 Tax=Sphaerisporangium melleum TaxID=321316 RepID=A0A917VC80_9ACTN|nr:hypothetical protein [Sphaerisporangium melleum]GGK61854.1 hypothetical protein GCM10007964_01250 [Sphaerisporangium melleum]GII67894.1 hypothetical protein Sme01_03700 [Sphaerisporangium melleum]